MSQFWIQIIHFLISSTGLLVLISLADSFKLLSQVRLRMLLWKLGILASLFFLLPLPKLMVVNIPLAQMEGATILNEARSTAAQGLSTVRTEVPGPVRAAEASPNPEADAPNNSPAAPINQNIVAGSYGKGFTMSGVLLSLWGAVSLILLLRLAMSYREGIASIGRREPLESDDPKVKRLHRLCLDMDIARAPEITRSEHLASPITLLTNEICLPAWADDIDDVQLTSLLAHELGHIRRRDPQLLLAMQCLCCMFFFQPLFVLAKSRFQRLAELLADESAVSQCKDTGSVARLLLNCAKQVTYRDTYSCGFSMMGTTSQLRERIEKVLLGSDTSSETGGAAERFGLFLFMASIVMVSPGLDFVAGAAEVNRQEIGNGSSSAQISNGGGNWVWEQGNDRLEVNWRGEFQLNDAENDIVTMSDGGVFEIEAYIDGQSRRARYEADNGVLSRSYWTEGEAAAFDAEARDWFREMMVALMRRTGVLAEERIGRLLERGGFTEVLDELTYLKTDHVMRVYVTEIYNTLDLAPTQFEELMAAAASISSDSEMRRLLASIAGSERMSGDYWPAIFANAETISSDSELRRLLSPLPGHGGLSDDNWTQILVVAETITSDREQRQLLTTLAGYESMSERNWVRLLEVAGTISSDREMRELLASLTSTNSISEGIVRQIFVTARSISSDREQRLFLIDAVEFGLLTNGTADFFMTTVSTISSGREKDLLVDYLLDTEKIDDPLRSTLLRQII